MRFRRENRMKQSEYDKVFQSGKRYRSGSFTFIVLDKQNKPHKLGIVVSRKVARGVARNRLRRRIIEIIRQCNGFGSDIWMIIITRPGSSELTFTDIKSNIEKTFKKIESERTFAKG